MGKRQDKHADPIPTWEDIPPGLAKKYLATMPKNRRVRKKHADNLTLLMKDGHWKKTGDAIRFNQKGELIDGQHRLMAVIASGITIRTLVIREVPNNAFMDLDTGAVRSPGDLLSIAGHKFSNNIASIIRLANSILEIEDGKVGPTSFGKRKMPPATLLKWGRDYGDGLLDAVKITTTADARNVCRPPSVFGALYFLFADYNPKAAKEFFETLAEGADFEYRKEDPIYVLRRTLLGMREKKHLKRPNYYKAAITIKAWNLYQDRQKSKMPTLRFSEVEGWPEINRRVRRLNETEAEAHRVRREKRAEKVREYDRKSAAKKAADTKAKKKAAGEKASKKKTSKKKTSKKKSRSRAA
jgi:hypothetical protein